MNKRRFEVNINCASCANKVAKAFKKYPDIKYALNILEKIIVVEANEDKYDNDFIIDLIKQAGYDAEEI